MIQYFKRCAFYGIFYVMSVSAFMSCNSAGHTNKSSMKTSENLFAPESKPTIVSQQFSFTEGPAADKDGNVYFTDQPNNQIWKYSIDGKLSLFTDHSLRSNGLYVDPKGNVVGCADEKGQLVAFDHQADPTVVMDDINGLRANGPNDLWIDGNGGIYFTDPYYKRPYWPEPKPTQHKENVYYLAPGTNNPVMIADDLEKPNGIIGTADGKTLFVADIGGNKIFKYTITAPGKISGKQLFAPMGSDGMTLDEKGNLYLTGKGVTIYSASGEKIANIPIDEDWTANLCFGGKNNDQLFITASKGFYVLPMLVKGMKK